MARFECLDTLRFLAALAVVLSHARAMWPVESLDPVMRSGLLDPKSAVAFFFVLSGFVLHLSWKGAWPQWRGYGNFIVRRVFRIYPLYYLSLVLAAGVLWLLPLGECPAFTLDAGGAEVLAQDRSDKIQWLHHLLLVTPGLDMQFLNPPIWTLAAEMRVAIVFPWLSWLATSLGLWRGLAVLVLLLATGPWLGQKTLPTAALLPVFFFGAWAAEHRARLHVSNGRALLMLGLGVLGYSAAAMLRGRDFTSQTWHMYGAGAGSVLIIVAILAQPTLRAFLEKPSMVTGGRASYGIYVLHFPALMALAYLAWKQGLSPAVFQLLGVAVSLALAVPLYHHLEMPMMKVGRKAASYLFKPDASRHTALRKGTAE